MTRLRRTITTELEKLYENRKLINAQVYLRDEKSYSIPFSSFNLSPKFSIVTVLKILSMSSAKTSGYQFKQLAVEYVIASLNASLREIFCLILLIKKPKKTNNGRIVLFGGGIPLVENDQVIGAVGVSCSSVEHDVQVSEAAVNAFESLKV